MLIDIFRQFNFLDIILLIVLFRICYVALKMGLPVEIFKLLGVLSAIFISLHYYTILSNLIQKQYSLNNMPLEFMDFLISLILVVASYLIFVVLRSIFCRFMKMEATPKINKFGGLILGLVRGVLVIGLISYILGISSISYLARSVKYSYLGSRAFAIAPRTYTWLWSNIFSKFSSGEKLNPTVNEVKDNFSSK